MMPMPCLFFRRIRQAITVSRLAWAARGLIAVFLIANVFGFIMVSKAMTGIAIEKKKLVLDRLLASDVTTSASVSAITSATRIWW